jgi:hypothetical protein
VPLGGVEAGVVGPREDARGGEPLREPLRFLARDAVDDRSLSLVATEDREGLCRAVRPRHHAVDEVGPVEDADEGDGIVQVQLPGDVVADPRRGGGREGMDACRRKPFAQQGELTVLRAEIVAPLADAVGLVDREACDAHAGQGVEKPGVHEPLRSGEQEPQIPRRQAVADGRPLVLRHAAVDRGR